jgi:hypothetical protein
LTSLCRNGHSVGALRMWCCCKIGHVSIVPNSSGKAHSLIAASWTSWSLQSSQQEDRVTSLKHTTRFESQHGMSSRWDRQ